jgi:hypothetical protein
MPVVYQQGNFQIDTKRNFKKKSKIFIVVLFFVFVMVSLMNSSVIFTSTKDFKESFYQFKLILQ